MIAENLKLFFVFSCLPVDCLTSCTLAVAHALKLGKALGLASPNRCMSACEYLQFDFCVQPHCEEAGVKSKIITC